MSATSKLSRKTWACGPSRSWSRVTRRRVTGQHAAAARSCSSARWRGSQNQISCPRACASSIRAKVVSPAIWMRASGSKTKRNFIAPPLWARLVLGGQEVLEAVLAHPVVQGGPVDAQRTGGVSDVPLRLLHRRHDLVALLLGQPLVQRPSRVRRLG